MNVKEFVEKDIFKVVHLGSNPQQSIREVFCCDLLSIAMGRAPADSVWVTVMSNINTLAVASLTDVACIVFAEGSTLDESTLQKAKVQGITIFYTDLPIFEAALAVHQLL
ncbi:hypothetical protein [Clostridium aminobutyricum]|uniref:DRTGG domain-containing protein n=1 Tax=Clostridium aminobutyricum TaxID=33953 RepID=A0A939D7B4_CLOAM|nr:hypothetical protein [Clostridium aminobutyricum]MBN7772068.1 hypothetical protein [Clostridium aminobutyricum]